jgi:TPP-dependent pyruvate/acetoin dehydrogenase alpha subunit
MENSPGPVDSSTEGLSFDKFKTEVLADYRWVRLSREVSVTGRKEVLTGKAKFGIFGDGKEVAQVAMAKFFRNGDFRSGYYRDQTFMFASGLANVDQFFAQLYADPDIEHDPFSAGRQMNAHFATKWVDENGEWRNLVAQKNSSADIAPTAGQMTRGLGLAFASKCFRNIKELQGLSICLTTATKYVFAQFGDASTSEGHFWETD